MHRVYRFIHNLDKYLSWSFLQKQTKAFSYFCKRLHLKCLSRFRIHLCSDTHPVLFDIKMLSCITRGDYSFFCLITNLPKFNFLYNKLFLQRFKITVQLNIKER